MHICNVDSTIVWSITSMMLLIRRLLCLGSPNDEHRARTQVAMLDSLAEVLRTIGRVAHELRKVA